MIKLKWFSPLNKKRFYLAKLALSIYTLGWTVILFLIWYSWDVAIWLKLFVNVLLIIGTPSLKDIIIPFDEYLNDWKEKHTSGG